MAGSCTAFVRSSGNVAVVYIPYRFWGLTVGETYRVMLSASVPPGAEIPYSFDARLQKTGGKSAKIHIPKCVSVNVGDYVQIWVGRPEDFNNERGWAYGRGHNKKERTTYLEEQADILRRCTRQQIHNERVP